MPPPRCSFVFGRPGEISGCSKSRVVSQAGVRTLGESSFDVVGATVAELVSKCDHLTHGDALRGQPYSNMVAPAGHTDSNCRVRISSLADPGFRQ